MTNQNQTEFQNWIEKEKAALQLITTVGQLSFERSIELMLFRRPLFDIGSSEALAIHQYARDITEKDISVYETLELAKAIKTSNLAPSRIDLGILTLKWIEQHQRYTSIHDFITKELAKHIGSNKAKLTPKDVILFGFGRIGRVLAREIVSQTGKGEQLRLRAIVVRGLQDGDLQKRADLFKYDSIYKDFKGTVSINREKKALIINGQFIQLITGTEPETIDYTQYGIDNALLIDNTGAFRDREGLEKHLRAKGVSKVLLTAPGKDDIPNIVAGINEHQIDFKKESVFSCASCTTNAVAPVLLMINKHFMIKKAHIETIHAYTNDQNLLDNFHKKDRRGRAAASNLVITETGSAKAISKVIPTLNGKLTGNAVRVPVPSGSLAILHLQLSKSVVKETIESILKTEALFGPLSEQVDYSISREQVSSDVIGNNHTCVIDGPATIVSDDGKTLVIYVWYDNEYGYCRQVIRLAKKIAEVVRLTYY